MESSSLDTPTSSFDETWFNSNVPRVVFIDDTPTTISGADRTLADRRGFAIVANDRYKATVFPLISEFGCAMISGALLTIVIYNPLEKSQFRISDETLLDFIE